MYYEISTAKILQKKHICKNVLIFFQNIYTMLVIRIGRSVVCGLDIHTVREEVTNDGLWE